MKYCRQISRLHYYVTTSLRVDPETSGRNYGMARRQAGADSRRLDLI